MTNSYNIDLKKQDKEKRKEEMFAYWENKMKQSPQVPNSSNKTKSIIPILFLSAIISVIGLIVFINFASTSINEIKEEKKINLQKQKLAQKLIKSDLDKFLAKALNTAEGNNKYQLISLGSDEKVGRYNKAKVSYNLKWLDKQGNIYYTDENLSADDWSYFNTPSAWFEVLQMIGVGGKIELYCPIESMIFKDTDLPNQTAFLIEIQLDGIIPLDESPDEELVVKTELEHRNVVELHTKQNTTIRKCSSLYCDVLGLMPKDSVLIPIKDENGQNIIENNWIKVEYNGRFCTNPKDKDCSSRSAVKSVEGWVMDAAL